jgi:DNA primase small subunit
VSSRDFVYGKFSDFYSNPSTIIPSPSLLGQRELAFFLFKERIMLRHKSFTNIDALKLFLSETVPSDAYHSCAYYESPRSEMDKKGWLGADLVFDIDADHIPTSCNKLHDQWTCKSCGLSGKGATPENCSKCGGQRFDTKTWPCEQCLGSAKEETSKLIDMLKSDFGFSDKEVRVFFSGHRGYHVHVENEAVKALDAMGRKEIVDYVSGLGLSILGLEKISKGKLKSTHFLLHDFAWNKRLKHGMRNFIRTAAKEDLQNIGLRKITNILRDKDIKNLESAKIDTVVTTDIHRLIRLNGTLHGKTGLKKVEFSIKRLEDFDPFEEAVAFKKGAVKVFVSDAPEFRLVGNVLGPFRGQAVELPTAAAILLICKGRAEVVAS